MNKKIHEVDPQILQLDLATMRANNLSEFIRLNGEILYRFEDTYFIKAADGEELGPVDIDSKYLDERILFCIQNKICLIYGKYVWDGFKAHELYNNGNSSLKFETNLIDPEYLKKFHPINTNIVAFYKTERGTDRFILNDTSPIVPLTKDVATDFFKYYIGNSYCGIHFSLEVPSLTVTVLRAATLDLAVVFGDMQIQYVYGENPSHKPLIIPSGPTHETFTKTSASVK